MIIKIGWPLWVLFFKNSQKKKFSTVDTSTYCLQLYRHLLPISHLSMLCTYKNITENQYTINPFIMKGQCLETNK